MARKLLSILLATGVLVFGGVCFAGGNETTIKLVAFNESTDVLVGSLPGGAMGDFQRTHKTQHLLSKPNTLPPGPCKGLAVQWDHEVRRGTRGRARFEKLLDKMAKHQCPLDIQVTSEAPASADGLPELIQIRPGN